RATGRATFSRGTTAFVFVGPIASRAGAATGGDVPGASVDGPVAGADRGVLRARPFDRAARLPEDRAGAGRRRRTGRRRTPAAGRTGMTTSANRGSETQRKRARNRKRGVILRGKRPLPVDSRLGVRSPAACRFAFADTTVDVARNPVQNLSRTRR